MNQTTSTNSSAAPNLSVATTHFLDKREAFLIFKTTSLNAENAALTAELTALIGQGPLLGVEFDWKDSKAASEEASKLLNEIMNDFDAEGGRPEEREDARQEMERRLKGIKRQMSWTLGFKDAIARYKARDG